MARYGYTRVSTTEQADGNSLDAQRSMLHALGVDDAHIFEDAGVSGSVPLDQRPQGAALLAALKRGDVVVAAKLDRAFRSALDALYRVDALRTAGVDVILADISPTSPVTQNGAGGMFFKIMAAVADFERERVLDRMAEGRRAKKARGGHIAGSRPFGYTVVGHGKAAMLEPIPEEQTAIARMKAMRLEGASLRTIAAAMKADGFQISHEAVNRVLREEADV